MGWTSPTWLGGETALLEESGRGVGEVEEVFTVRLVTAERGSAPGVMNHEDEDWMHS